MEDTATIPQKWQQCNGQQFKKLVRAGLIWLEQHRGHVNDLNVFPVPDGDTGTNMLLTMQSASGRVAGSDELHLGKVAQAVANGALMGARGNSGVILSQIWRGLAKGLQDKETANAADFAQALQEASDTAYKGVMRPVEGTILTVIREGSEEAVDAAGKSTDLRFLLERTIERCQQSLERTPDLLPVLKQAGVVDSGGQGLVYILQGMLRYVTGEMKDLASAQAVASNASHSLPAQAHAIPEGGQIENPYDVQFILLGENLDVIEVRNRIDAMGDSTVVVGDETTIKVHIHVKDPGEPLTYGISLGQVTDVVVENMQMQMEEIITPAPQIEAVKVEHGQIGVVAVAAGGGFANIFRSLGVAHLVSGGQTNNPSTKEILQAIGEVPTDKIIVLPNNKNIILAAEAARDLSAKQVAIIPTRTMPQGVGAMLALNPNGELDAVAGDMEFASQDVASGEITVATRTVTLDGVDVAEGQVIGLANGRLCTSGDNMNDVFMATLEAMELNDRELLSVYYGEDTNKADAETLLEQVEEKYPDVEVELLHGGQPHYYYILGAE